MLGFFANIGAINLSLLMRMDYAGCADEELVALLIKGDREAYAQIYHRYKRLLYGFALRRLGSGEETEDLLHELFLSLWNNRAGLDSTRPLAPYLYNAARYRLINAYAKRKSVQRYLESFNEYLSGEISSQEADHLVRYKELSGLIEREVAALPGRMREVFELSRKEGYSRRQIALELGLSEETVKSHMHHALKLLKAKLGTMSILLFL